MWFKTAQLSNGLSATRSILFQSLASRRIFGTIISLNNQKYDLTMYHNIHTFVVSSSKWQCFLSAQHLNWLPYVVLYLHHTGFMVLHGFCTGFAQVLHRAGVICCGMLIRWCVTQPARSGDPFPRLHETVQWLFTSMTSSTLEQHHHNSLTTSYARLRALWSREQRDKSMQKVNIKKASSITLSESILNWFCWLAIPRISSCCSESDLTLKMTSL